MKNFSAILVVLGFGLFTCSVVSAEEDLSSFNISATTVYSTPMPERTVHVASTGPSTGPPTGSTGSTWSTVMPTTTPTPVPDPSFEVSKFIFKDSANSGKICFTMSGAFQINLTYIDNSGTNKTKNFAMGKEGVVNTTNSMCNSSSLQASITINRNASNQDPAFYINFIFVGDKKEEHWKISSIEVKIDTNHNHLPGYNSTGLVTFDAITDEITDTQVEFNRSFKCLAKQIMKLNTTNNTIQILPVLTVKDFQVQVFKFTNATTGDFGQARQCSMDANKGNKIVPIAVGAALAGLVIVVLIAYLIGRLRSRRQSSYEALS